MGTSICYRCDNCGYDMEEVQGYGFDYPSLCEETAQKMKNGDCGEEAKNLLNEYPETFVDCEYIPMQCTQCKKYDSRLSLTVHILGRKDMKYHHKCSHCGGDMKRLKDNEVRVCPVCGSKLTEYMNIIWD